MIMKITKTERPPGYFQGILQIRCENEKVLEDANRLLESMMKKTKAAITKTRMQKRGVDLWFDDKRKMKGIAENLAQELGGNVDLNPQLFSKDRQKSKNIYRLNILLQLPHYSIRDAILHDDKPYLIKGMGKNIKAIELETGRTKSIRYSKEDKVLEKQTTTISQVRPSIEAINPEDYQPGTIMNPVPGLKPGQKLKVVVHKGLFIV